MARLKADYGPSCYLLALPRELRDLVYMRLFAIQHVSETQVCLEYDRLHRLRPCLFSIAQLINNPICQTNKQIAKEAIETFLRNERVHFSCGPDVLRQLFELLDTINDGYGATVLQWLKRIELSWEILPHDLAKCLSEVDGEELWPLFELIATRTNIRSIAVPLYFKAKGYGPVSRRRDPYCSLVATHAASLLLEGYVEEIRIIYQPMHTMVLLDPSVDVEKLKRATPQDWEALGCEALVKLEKELWLRGYKYGLTQLSAVVELQPWEDGIGKAAIIQLRLPDADGIF